MFRGFLRTRPEVSIFHNPSSSQSNRALELLRSSLTSPYPPNHPKGSPLDFDLEVIESRAPTPDQLRSIFSFLPASSSPSISSVFLSAHPNAPTAAEQPQDADGLSTLVNRNLNAMRWPIVVDWYGGRASISDLDGVKAILEAIRKDRDGV